jgi:predicted transcriptional regulator
MKDEHIKLIGFVKASNYRFAVLKHLSEKSYTPTELAHLSQINKGHISRTLKELCEKNLAICGNDDAKKGRIYLITDKGKKVLSKL